MAGPITTAAEWFGKKIIEPATELGAKLIGRGGKASVEKGFEKLEPVMAKPRLTPEETKAFLKAQEEAKAAKAAAEATATKPKLTPEETKAFLKEAAEKRAAEKAAADAAKTGEAGTGGFKGAKAADETGKELSSIQKLNLFYRSKDGLAADLDLIRRQGGGDQAAMSKVISRYANDTWSRTGDKGKAIKGFGIDPEEAAKIAADTRLPQSIRDKVQNLADLSNPKANANHIGSRLKERFLDAPIREWKEFPVYGTVTAIPRAIKGIWWDAPKAVIGTVASTIRHPIDNYGKALGLLGLGYAGLKADAATDGAVSTVAGAAASVWATPPKAVYSALTGGSSAPSAPHQKEPAKGADGKPAPDGNSTTSSTPSSAASASNADYEDGNSLAGMLARYGIKAKKAMDDPMSLAIDQAKELLTTDNGLTQARQLLTGALIEHTHASDAAQAMQRINEEMTSKGFSEDHIASFNKFMLKKTTAAELGKDEIERLKESFEWFRPNANVAQLTERFQKNGVMKTVVAAAGGTAATVAAAGAGVGGAVVAAGAGVVDAVADEASQLAELNMLGQMAGIDTKNVKDIAASTAKATAEFAKKNPLAAGLGAYFGMQTEGHGVVGAAKKGMMGLIFAGLINWVMNAMGISSGQVANMGKGLFNNVLGPVTGTHLNTTSTGLGHAPRSQYDKGYFPFVSEANGMGSQSRASGYSNFGRTATTGSNGYGPATTTARYGYGPAQPVPVQGYGPGNGVPNGELRPTSAVPPAQTTNPVRAPQAPYVKEYGVEGATTSPVAPQSPDNSRPLPEFAADEAQKAIAKAQQSSKEALVQVDGVERRYGEPAPAIKVAQVQVAQFKQRELEYTPSNS